MKIKDNAFYFAANKERPNILTVIKCFERKPDEYKYCAYKTSVYEIGEEEEFSLDNYTIYEEIPISLVKKLA